MQVNPMLVLGLTLLFVVLLNLGIIYWARGSTRSAKIMSRTLKTLGKPFDEDNQKLNELSELVNRIKQEEKEKE